MKNYSERLAIRIGIKQRKQIDKLIEDQKFKDISHFLRTVIDQFLNSHKKGSNDASK